MAYEALELRVQKDAPVVVVAAAGIDPVPYIARAHLSGPRKNGPLVVVDATSSREHDLDRWRDPVSSPLALADKGAKKAAKLAKSASKDVHKLSKQAAKDLEEALKRREAQALAYFAGANSIFYGDKLLTAANPRANEDMKLLRDLGLAPLEPNPDLEAPKAMNGVPLSPCCDHSCEKEKASACC